MDVLDRDIHCFPFSPFLIVFLLLYHTLDDSRFRKSYGLVDVDITLLCMICLTEIMAITSTFEFLTCEFPFLSFEVIT